MTVYSISIMKLAIVFLSLAAFVAAEVADYTTAYGYLTRFGVPAAEKIRAREEEYFKNPLSRIFNGSPASLGQFPYQAGLVIALPSNTAVCGAILITNDCLLTAAHCWFDGQNQASLFTVVLGSVTIFTGGTRVQTRNVVMHPNWTPARVLNDIAVIRLPSRLTLSTTINVVALPSGSQTSDSFQGMTGTASGFGARGNVGIAANQFLSFANMNIISNAQCQPFFPSFIQSSNICTLTSASTCGGDSGGPLVVQRNNAPLLVGITSFGLHPNLGGCEVGHAAVFARVTSFISFINQHI